MNQYLSVKSNKAGKKLAEFIETTRKELNKFFNYEVQEPLFFFVDRRKELDLIWGRKTEKWLVGAAKNNSIYIFHPNVFAKESSHRKEEFWQTLKHEYCHIYYDQIIKTIKPLWLNEGLASYLSGKKLILKDGYKDKLLNIFLYFDQADKGMYLASQFWVEYLIKKFGKNKLVELIKSCTANMSCEQFATKFYKIYGIKFNKSTLKIVIKQLN